MVCLLTRGCGVHLGIATHTNEVRDASDKRALLDRWPVFFTDSDVDTVEPRDAER